MEPRALLSSPLWGLLDGRLLLGDCVELMASSPDECFDAIVTDPPYGLEFMGKDWDRLAPFDRARAEGTRRDHGTARLGGFERSGVRYVTEGAAMQRWHEAWAAEALRVLKPGGHLLAFGGTRTYHRLACALEDAGFELRDTIMWVYAQGFPKSKDAGEGRGTALKPAHEPITVARKPLAGTVISNVAAHGTGALNIAATKIPFADEADLGEALGKNPGRGDEKFTSDVYGASRPQQVVDEAGRWPANLILDEGAGQLLDEQSGIRPGGGYPERRAENSVFNPTSGGSEGPRSMGDSGGASRFFFCPKVGRLERDLGLADFEAQALLWSSGEQSPGTFQSEGTDKSARNHHPTVKPIDLMRWLCRLVTPPGGVVLDPFAGSGSTGCAAVMEGFEFVGLEQNAEFVAIAEARIELWATYEGAETEAALRSAAAKHFAQKAGQLGLLEREEEPCPTGS